VKLVLLKIKEAKDCLEKQQQAAAAAPRRSKWQYIRQAKKRVSVPARIGDAYRK